MTVLLTSYGFAIFVKTVEIAFSLWRGFSLLFRFGSRGLVHNFSNSTAQLLRITPFDAGDDCSTDQLVFSFDFEFGLSLVLVRVGAKL